jgi:hypothetical protein
MGSSGSGFPCEDSVILLPLGRTVAALPATQCGFFGTPRNLCLGDTGARANPPAVVVFGRDVSHERITDVPECALIGIAGSAGMLECGLPRSGPGSNRDIQLTVVWLFAIHPADWLLRIQHLTNWIQANQLLADVWSVVIGTIWALVAGARP